MKTRTSSLAVVVAACLVACALLGLQAKAGILIYDSFTAPDDTPLQGHTPDITIGAASWNAPGGGTIIGDKAANGYQDVYIAFAPASNKIYTLSAEMTSVNPTAGFLSLAFETVANNWWDYGFASTAVYNNGQVYSGDFGPSVGLTPQFTVTAGSTHTYAVVLDTTGANWKADWFFDGAATPWYSHTYTGAPAIVAISMYRYGDSGGTFDDLTLSAIPEPSAAALLAAGLVGSLTRAWRKRR